MISKGLIVWSITLSSVMFALSCWSNRPPNKPALSQIEPPGDAPIKTIESQVSEIDEAEIRKWITTFSSDRFNGRLAGSPHGMAAGTWLRDKLESFGIEPAGDDSTYFQCFDKGYNEFHALGSLELHVSKKKKGHKQPGSGKNKSYSFPREFFPGSNTGRGRVTAEVVWVGHGVSAPELGYDDYEGIDVRGKIVLLNRSVPVKNPRDPSYEPWAKYTGSKKKVEAAAAHGAVGLLYSGQTHANPNITHIPGFLVAGIGRTVTKDLLEGTGKKNGLLLEKIAKDLKPRSFSTRKTVTMTANTTWHPQGRACNVIGVIEGQDPRLKDEIILIGAHYDGVGNCSVVLPGALDNASGTIDILAAAQAMAKSGIPLKRSVGFVFFSGEETGLDGSQFYVANPRFSKEKTICYINLDMVGNGTGFFMSSDESDENLIHFFTRTNEKYLTRSFKTAIQKTSYSRMRSDGQVFKRAGYPLLQLGLTDWNKPYNYHLPTDRVDLTVDTGIMTEVVKLLFVSLTEMANAETL